jgi:hypothetical protein
MRGRFRYLSMAKYLQRHRFRREAQNHGEAPSPELLRNPTSPRTRGEVKKSRSRGAYFFARER